MRSNLVASAQRPRHRPYRAPWEVLQSDETDREQPAAIHRLGRSGQRHRLMQGEADEHQDHQTPQIAQPTIEHALAQFLAEQRARLKLRTVAKYEAVIELLQDHLNGYAYTTLSPAEAALFRTHFNATGSAHREFSQLFGPAKSCEQLSSFLGYFMIRKVLAGEELKRAAGTVTKKLAQWLPAHGYIADEGGRQGAAAARDLPNAERAAPILSAAADDLAIDPHRLDDEAYQEFDHYTIAKVAPGRLWLRVFTGGSERLLGPIPAPT